MNRFALEIKVASAELVGRYGGNDFWHIKMRFLAQDWPPLELASHGRLVVTLLFPSFKIDVVMVGWERVHAYDYIDVTWQSVGPLRVL